MSPEGEFTPTTVVVFDVDGVISPVHGKTAWGDDVIAGEVFGPVAVSPTMCVEIDRIAGYHGASCYWLTDWTQPMRHRMNPFPGRDWPAIAAPIAGLAAAQEWAGDWWEAMPWWKWWALDQWLVTRPHIRKLIWIDDDLRDFRVDRDASGGARRAWTIDTALRHGAHVTPILMAPTTSEGLRPLDVQIIREECHGYM